MILAEKNTEIPYFMEIRPILGLYCHIASLLHGIIVLYSSVKEDRFMGKKVMEVGENCKALWETVNDCLVIDGKKKSVSWLGNKTGVKPKTLLSQRDNNRTPDWEQIDCMFRALGKKVIIVPVDMDDVDLRVFDNYASLSDEDKKLVSALVERLCVEGEQQDTPHQRKYIKG